MLGINCEIELLVRRKLVGIKSQKFSGLTSSLFHSTSSDCRSSKLLTSLYMEDGRLVQTRRIKKIKKDTVHSFLFLLVCSG